MLTPGEEFTVEGEISRPETGVTLEVPETREAVYEVAPLAFYLGADVVPGDPPRLRAGEFTHRLDRAGDLQTGVKRVLQQVFFLDCVTRTEGTYKVDLRERAELEPHVDLDFEALYGAPLAEQLRAYLEIPYEVIEPHLPEWKATIDMPSDHSTVKVLPHALDDLAVVRCPDEPNPSKVDPEPQALTNFYRGASDDDPRNVVQPEPADSIEHLWVGEEMAIGASKVTPEVLARRLDATPRDEISVEVVCNHGVLDEARVVEDVYGRADYEFEVGVHEAVSTAELRELLESETDFLHFIGHVTEAGIKCPDGLLDVSELDEVGVRGFFLNGCRSYDQGELLVEKGSHAGIVTMATVADEQAADVGEDLARLLNHGFPMQSALSIATDANMPSGQYLTVGDAGIELCELKCGTPVVLRAEKKEDTISMELERYPTTTSTIGTFTTTKISGDEICSLNSSVLQANVDCESVQDFFDESTHAVQLEDRLAWTDDIAVEDL